jgi:hypothetical protein
MRLNIRLMGILFGILLLAIVGRGVMRSGAYAGGGGGGGGEKKNKNPTPLYLPCHGDSHRAENFSLEGGKKSKNSPDSNKNLD